MCDEQLVAHGLVETQGDSEVDAPVPRLSTATTGYQRLSSSRISWQAPCLAHWNLFVNRGRALLEHAPAAKLDPYFSTSATSTTPVGWVTSPAIVDLSYTGGSTLKPTTFSVTWRPVLAWIPSRLFGRRTNRSTWSASTRFDMSPWNVASPVSPRSFSTNTRLSAASPMIGSDA